MDRKRRLSNTIHFYLRYLYVETNSSFSFILLRDRIRIISRALTGHAYYTFPEPKSILNFDRMKLIQNVYFHLVIYIFLCITMFCDIQNRKNGSEQAKV